MYQTSKINQIQYIYEKREIFDINVKIQNGRW